MFTETQAFRIIANRIWKEYPELRVLSTGAITGRLHEGQMSADDLREAYREVIENTLAFDQLYGGPQR